MLDEPAEAVARAVVKAVTKTMAELVIQPGPGRLLPAILDYLRHSAPPEPGVRGNHYHAEDHRTLRGEIGRCGMWASPGHNPENERPRPRPASPGELPQNSLLPIAIPAGPSHVWPDGQVPITTEEKLLMSLTGGVALVTAQTAAWARA
jgi:hypothetical protein